MLRSQCVCVGGLCLLAANEKKTCKMLFFAFERCCLYLRNPIVVFLHLSRCVTEKHDNLLQRSKIRVARIFYILFLFPQVDGVSGMPPYSNIDAQGSSLAVPGHASNLMKSVSTPSIPSETDTSHGKGERFRFSNVGVTTTTKEIFVCTLFTL